MRLVDAVGHVRGVQLRQVEARRAIVLNRDIRQVRARLASARIYQAETQIEVLARNDVALVGQVVDRDMLDLTLDVRIFRRLHREAMQELGCLVEECQFEGARYWQFHGRGIHAGFLLMQRTIGDLHGARLMTVVTEGARRRVHAFHVVIDGGIPGAGYQHGRFLRRRRQGVGDADVRGLGRRKCPGGKVVDDHPSVAVEFLQVDHADLLGVQ